jgi:DNA polymerase III sliding clamp (beta) subunit (PCNA family)
MNAQPKKKSSKKSNAGASAKVAAPEGPIFYAEALDKGYYIKVLIDCLADFYDRLELKLTPKGINILHTDQRVAALHVVVLNRDGFKGYVCKRQEIHISLDLKLLQTQLKNVKKKETITIVMPDDQHIRFKVKPDSKGSTSNRSEKFTQQVTQEENSDDSAVIPLVEETYHPPVVIDSTDYQKMKKQKRDGKLVVQMLRDEYLSISDVDATHSSKLSFGHVPKEQKEDLYTKTFNKDTLKKTAKITGLSEYIHFCCPKEEGLALLIKVKVGNYGDLMMFIKDKEMLQERDNNANGDIITY